jgi:class 3 adenylate cyclase
VPFLEWLQGGRTRGRIELREGAVLRLGRGADADGRVDGDPYMSRLHVEVVLEGDGLRVRRLPNATNAVFHGGVEKEELRLELGDSFVVGATRFRFASEASGTLAPRAASPASETVAESSPALPTARRPAAPRPAQPAEAGPVSEPAQFKHALERFFSPRVVESLLAGKNLKALEPKLADASVLFLGIPGFVELFEAARSEAAGFQEKLLAAMTGIAEEVFKEDGAVLQYSGDGLLAGWNAPYPQEDHVDRACRAALAIAKRLAALDPSLRFGIGLQTGRVVAGPVGSDQAFAYGLVGPVVDQAARVEGITRLLGATILASRAVEERLSPSCGVAAIPLGFFRPAGMAAGLELYEFSAGPADPRRLAAFEAFETEFAAGSWDAAAAALKSLPVHDAPARALAGLAKKYSVSPPRDWRGVVDLSE